MNNTSQIYTIAFYNIENLFDTENDPTTYDDDFLPTAKKRWTTKRYHNKLRKLSSVISKIKNVENDNSPAIIGLAEVENKNVLSDLINSKYLKDIPYDFVHYNSSDERGIDVALLYDKSVFTVTDSQTYSIYLQDEDGQRDYTRDILLVKGILANDKLNILVNHWSSRRQGEKETEHKRILAAKKVNAIIQKLKQEEDNAKIIVMGDFNDNPNNNSVKLLEKDSNLFNPFKTIWSHNKGSLNHDFEWHLFDQILCSPHFFNAHKKALSYYNANVFNSRFLTQYNGRYKNQPFRTYVGKKYKGGYSDHFPVYIQLKKK